MKNFLERFIVLLTTFALIFSVVNTTIVRAAPISPADCTEAKLRDIGAAIVSCKDSSCDLSNPDNSSGAGTPGTETPKWVTSLQPPYSLEDFAVEALRALAKKLNVPESSTVTQEHVLNFVAQTFREGGNITNSDLYNPWNTGYTGSDLKPVSHSVSGVQAYSSFNDGVEAYARVWSGTAGSSGYQSRLGTVFSNPNSTADDVARAFVYFKETPGNKAWAEGSVADPANYYQGLKDIILQTRKNYNDRASIEVGPPGGTVSSPKKIHDPAPLRYQFAGDSSGNPGVGNDANASNNSNCACSTGDINNGAGNVIVIDPGHSGNDITVTDPQTGIMDHDYPNSPEMTDVFDVAQIVKTQLEAAGYKVILTKASASDTVTLRQRADIANSAKASLALSIHDQSNLPFQTQNNQVYVQRDGQFRLTTNGQKVAFNNPGVSSKSQQFGQIFVEERGKSQGGKIDLMQDASAGIGGGRGGNIAGGNMWLVQLFSTVPWIYNESGGQSQGQASGLNVTDKNKYATGLVESVKRSVPLGSNGNTANISGNSSGCSNSGGVVAGNITQTAVNFSWPANSGTDETGKTYNSTTDPRPAFKAALDQFYPTAGSRSRDCSMFTGIVMRASGVDPNFPLTFTGDQLDYAFDNPAKYDVVLSVSDTSQLQPGDIMIAGGSPKHPSASGSNGAGAAGHTYIYIGPQANGNIVAQASQNDYYPRQGKTAPLTGKGGFYARIRVKQ